MLAVSSTRYPARSRLESRPFAGRKKGGRGGERACHTGQQRSLPVNHGHSKTDHDLGRNALTSTYARIPSGVRFPQRHEGVFPRKRGCHSRNSFGGPCPPQGRYVDERCHLSSVQAMRSDGMAAHGGHRDGGVVSSRLTSLWVGSSQGALQLLRRRSARPTEGSVQPA